MSHRFVQPRAPLRTAVVGYGYWGPNLVRNVIERPELEFAGLCERDAERARGVLGPHTRARRSSPTSTSCSPTPTIDAVLVATPPHTHHPIVRAALEAGKHVLVEKPLATTSDDARDLIEVAERRGLTLMPGHTFLYSPPVNKVKQLIVDGALGEIYFVTSSRMNLGKYQSDGVICDLAPHDLSILLYWLDEPVVVGRRRRAAASSRPACPRPRSSRSRSRAARRRTSRSRGWRRARCAR